VRMIAARPAGRTGLVIVLVAGTVLAACGGSEKRPRQAKIPAGLAQDFAAQADAIAASLEAGDPCGAREQAVALQAAVTQAINGGRIPTRFRQELQSTVDELVQIECVPPEPPPQESDSCAALEERKEELDTEKEAIKEIEDEGERKAREQELEAEKKAVEEGLKACREEEKEED
jgi:hypothetical protein